MSLTIRLSRAGARKRPFYRVVVADSRSPRDGRFLERLGTYDPMLARDHPERVRLDAARIRHWLEVGARPSERVARFLGAAEIAPMPPRRNNPNKGKPRARALERQAAREEKAGAVADSPPAPAAGGGGDAGTEDSARAEG